MAKNIKEERVRWISPVIKKELRFSRSAPTARAALKKGI